MSFANFVSGAFGAGLVLVVLPSAALFFGMSAIDNSPGVGLPLMAIFGIVILFGAMALTSTLFMRLGLGNRNEALALPTGSVRAAIAMSLIVLFAIIAIMVFHTLAQPYPLRGLSEKEKLAVLSEPRNRIFAVQSDACPPGKATLAAATSAASAPSSGASASNPSAASPGECFRVDLVPSAGQEAVDVAKQLLVLIGTLMTSVTSFYFASARPGGTSGSAPPEPGKAGNVQPAPAPVPSPAPKTGEASGLVAPATAASIAAASTYTGSAGRAAPAGAQDEEHADGCDVPVDERQATRDEDLPAATGGVA